MGRGTKPDTSHLASNPYPQPKAMQPKITLCELCDREILTVNWNAHKNSKKHRGVEQKEKYEADTANNNVLGADSAGFNAADYLNSGAVGNNDWNSVGGLGGSNLIYKKTNGGGNGCFVCGDTTHQKRECPQGGSGGTDQGCFKCGLVGHRKADCPELHNSTGGGRPDRVCFNCHKPGHNKSDCTEPPVMRCRNCDDEGHQSYECTKPKDWSRVKCTNCKDYGHGAKRCPEPPIDESDAARGGWGNGAGHSPGEVVGNWENSPQAITTDWADDSTIAANTNGGGESSIW